MSVVIESAIGDENMLYPSMEQPENDALNDSRDVSKDDSNAMMEEQMSSSNDQMEDFPQKPQHIFVMDRESSLGKREHDFVFDRRASESSVSESSATSPRRHARSYGKKKQKLSARQRKRRLERSFGSDFKPGTIRHRLNFLQHNFGDQLTLIEESLPETFHRNMNLEIFIRNKMEQHEQHRNTDNASVRRSPSFRRSPERQRKSSLKETPGIKESAQEQTEQTEQSEMAEIMTFAPRETPHFESSASELETPDRSPAGHFSYAIDRSAREWRLSKFLEESPPPSPERKAITVEVPVEAALPEVPSLNESDVPALAAVEDAAVVAVPEPTSDVPTAVEEEKEATPSSAPVSSFSMVSATGIVETVATTPEMAPKEAPFDEEPVVDSPVTEEAATPAPLAEEPVAEEMPATEEPQVEEPAATEEALEVVAATPKETEEPATPAATLSVAVAPAETVQEGVAGEPEAPQEEDPVSVQVKESASQIPNVGEDTPSRGESPEAQAKKAVQVAPEVKLEAPIVVVSEPEGVVSEPLSMGVETPETAPQDAPAVSTRDGVAQEESSNDNEAPAMTIETSSASSDNSVVPSTPVGDQSVTSASMESPKALDAVEQARMEQATPVKAVASEATTPPTPDAVERARLEQQTPVKRKHEDATSDDAASKAEASDKADATDATDENKDSQNCPSPSSVMDTELGDGEGKVKKQCALKENRKLRFADELGKPLTKEHIIEREANYASRIVVMLLSPRDRKFEFLHAEYPLDESTTVQVLLEQVPLLATNDAFRTKKFNALLQTETSRQLDNALALQDYCFKESEIVLGIPDDFTVANMTKMAVPLLLNKKLMKTVKQAIRKGRGLKTVQSGVEWRK